MTRKTGPLSPHEAALWKKLAATVEPLHRKSDASEKLETPTAKRTDIFSANADKKPSRKDFAALISPSPSGEGLGWGLASKAQRLATSPSAAPLTGAPSAQVKGLDGHWDRRFVRGRVEPDITVDLHGHTLASAYTRLDQSLSLAIGAGFRVILLITGKARAERETTGRGAIRAAVADWLAASRHASSIAAVRNAHPRHGGSGALYIVLRR